ncbi:hypothetical protein [Paenibacillus azoreducens]|uniref:Uncharacterized protein n=1 Tax=Paenibacillus azoreducens TaxID=116718 RepID=A0A919YAG4_9BACL|nr:hypothetical protein [Paenibacillus azoreducens]GIO47961.1 hypothetical protein J34TS1_27260 [Paenibacillus azoreducens]
MAKGITLQELDSSAFVNLVPYLGTTSNNGDAFSITTVVPIDVNQKFTIKFNAASSTAPILKINDGTSHPIKKANGNNAKLYASVYTLFWDGSAFILQGEGGGGNAQPGDVLAGKTFTNDDGEAKGTMPNRGNMRLTPTNQRVTIPEGYHNGSGYVDPVYPPSPNATTGKVTIPAYSYKDIPAPAGMQYTAFAFYNDGNDNNSGFAFPYGYKFNNTHQQNVYINNFGYSSVNIQCQSSYETTLNYYQGYIPS